MVFVELRPLGGLAPFVESFGYFEERLSHGRERILPSGRLQLLVNLHEDRLRTFAGDGSVVQSVGGAAVVGARPTSTVVDTVDQRATICVSFRHGGAFPFFTVPASSTAGGLVELEELWGGHGRLVRDRLLAVPTPLERLTTLHDILIKVAVRPLEPDPAVGFAVAALGAGVPVAEVTDRLGMLPKRFIRHFTDRVGLTPKRFSRVRRLQRALASVPANGTADWAQIAAVCGYFDQSHLIRDFRALGGITPGAYRPRTAGDRNHVPLVG